MKPTNHSLYFYSLY